MPVALPAVYGGPWEIGVIPSDTGPRHVSVRATPDDGRFQFRDGAIFFEASNVPNMIDHNIIYNVSVGSGVYARDCDKLLIAHNLVVNCDHAAVHMRKTESRDRVGVCKDSDVINNVLVGCGVAFDYERMGNVSDYNILAGMGEEFSLDDWQKSGLDANSTTIELELAIGAQDQRLAWSSATDVPAVSRHELFDVDYYGRPYPGDEVPVGPFAEGLSPVCRRLRLTAND